MKKLRPNQILKMGSDFGNSYTNFVPQKYSGSMHALQYVMLIKLLNLVKPKVVFEFGTYMGNTTRFILENMINFSNETKIVYTIDVDMKISALKEDCSQRGGRFNSCGTICETSADMCAAVCAFTCEF